MHPTDFTLSGALAALNEGAISAEELTRAHVAAVEALNPKLNAFITTTSEQALDAARASDARRKRGEAGPLEGIPLAIKDLFCTEGVRTTAGSKILGNFIPPYESTVTAQLKRDGAVFLGKANLDEFAMGSSNLTSAYGGVLNPWQRKDDPAARLVPGGSSGGSAAAVAARMIEHIKAVRSEGDSVGGVIECVVRGVPPGLGEPVFDRLEADIAKGVLSLPATKGFEIGSGFDGTTLRGSEYNDPFFMEEGRVRTRTNRSGGVQGGISNGEAIVFRVAFKPTATIFQTQETVSPAGEDVELKARGRHDACVLPRAVPMVEAMTVLVLTDHALRQRAQNG
jgi:hypothetical protein